MWYATSRRRWWSLVACALMVSFCALVHVSSAVAKDGEPRKRSSPKRVKPAPRGHDHAPIGPRVGLFEVFPPQPFEITVTSVTDSTISIEWNPGWNSWPGGGVVGYRVFTNGLWVASTPDAAYTFTSLSCDTSYVFGVAGYNALGKQSPGAFKTASTDACEDKTAPNTPGNVHVSEATGDSVTIAWDASSDEVGVAGYGVYSGDTWIDSTEATSYTLRDLPCGTSRLLAVDAFDAAGNRSLPAVVPATTAACVDTAPLPIAGQGYGKVFGGEFDSLDRSVWDDHIWYDDPPSPSWAPTQYVENGILNLVSRRNDAYPGCTTNCYPIITVTTMSSGKSFQYGYFEARMRWTKGAGSWPAFWLLSTAWAHTGSCETPSGELDVMEGQGTEPTVLYGTIHRESASQCGGNEMNENNWQPVGVDLTESFHTYGALWTATTVSWYLDDRLIMAAPTYPTSNQPMFLLLQMWSGGWTSDPDSTTPDELRTEVDWVRVWQK